LTNQPELIVLDPSFRSMPAAQPLRRNLAGRPASIAGGRIALVINGLGRSSVLAEKIGKRLLAEGAAEIMPFLKPGISVPPSREDWDTMRQRATGAVALFGGCGSCSTRSFRDAVELEWAGIPAVPLIHEAVAQGVRVLARIVNMTDYPYILLGKPYHNLCVWTDDEIDAVVDQVVPQIIARLSQTVPATLPESVAV